MSKLLSKDVLKVLVDSYDKLQNLERVLENAARHGLLAGAKLLEDEAKKEDTAIGFSADMHTAANILRNRLLESVVDYDDQ